MIGYGLDSGSPKDSENAPNSFLTKINEKGFWRFAVDICGSFGWNKLIRQRDLGLWGPVIGSSSVEYFFIYQRHFFMFWWVGRETSEVRCQVTNLVMAKEGHNFIFYSPQQTFLIKDWTFLSGSNYKWYKMTKFYQDKAKHCTKMVLT